MRLKRFFIELNLRKKKWLLFCSYDPKYSQIPYHFSKIGKALDYLTSNSDNIIVMGNFNVILMKFFKILCGFHIVCITVIRMCYSNQKRFIILDHKFKKYNNGALIKDFSKSFSKEAVLFDPLRKLMSVTQ